MFDAMQLRRISILLVVTAVAVAGCSRGDDDESATTTTSSPGGLFTSTTTTPGTGDGTVQSDPPTTGGGVSTTTGPSGVANYSIERRISESGGDTVVVLVAPGTYSDLDLQNIVVDVIERFAPIAELHIVDDRSAVDLVLTEEAGLTAEEQGVLAEHYFVRFEEGFRLVYQGPFNAFGEIILGS